MSLYEPVHEFVGDHESLHSVKLTDEETTVSLHNESRTTVESVALPVRNRRVAVVFSSTVGAYESSVST
ncbi:hypothetical protein GJR96_07270 [Haloferax sp. MBLA0076]|uniref:Uncharacterized protein n=1 Tax=Haloferax litoreum TaxID=2666140 RepID=A0A6A8GF54_9EURY|nr:MULTISPECIES: hypothetical protein [Haloferax]KAB1193256.1 hypothetical protein Hfx1148_07265 [Haloferax sp. CBA1148]MRX21755.1 hypothetical protein [Haloferax litoreum]